MTRALVKWIGIAVVAIAAAGFGLYRLGESHGRRDRLAAPDGLAGSLAPTATSRERKPLYWHDPMVPGQRFDHPGKSPFMDMQLVPVYADGGMDAGGVHVEPRVQQNLGMRTAAVVSGTLVRTLETPGTVVFDERSTHVLEARTPAFVTHLRVRATLDRVRRGEALADLYSPDWVAAQEEFLTVRGLGADAGPGLVEAALQRMRLVGLSDAQIEAVASTGRVQHDVPVVSPLDGVVSELGAREGMAVAPGALLFRINALDRVWVQADVPESGAETLGVGTPAEIRTNALPGQLFRARVIAVLPNIAPDTRTRTVRLELPNPHGDLVPGMFTTVRFSPPSGPSTLLVPTEAVISTGTRTVIIVANGRGLFSPVDVEVGREGNGQTEIRKGLSDGQRVVVSGQFLIDSEASLTGALGRMAGESDGSQPAATVDSVTEPHP